MKIFASLFFFVSSMLFGAHVTGKWSGTLERTSEGSESSDKTDQHYLELQQNGTSLTGSAGAAETQGEIKKAKIEGGRIVLEIAPDGAPFTLVYDLNAAGDEVRGTVKSKGADTNFT